MGQRGLKKKMENGIYFHRDLREGYHRKMQLSGHLRMQMKQQIRWQKWEWIVTWVWLCLLFVVVYSPSLIQSSVVPITKKRGEWMALIYLSLSSGKRRVI